MVSMMSRNLNEQSHFTAEAQSKQRCRRGFTEASVIPLRCLCLLCASAVKRPSFLEPSMQTADKIRLLFAHASVNSLPSATVPCYDQGLPVYQTGAFVSSPAHPQSSSVSIKCCRSYDSYGGYRQEKRLKNPPNQSQVVVMVCRSICHFR